MKKPISWFLVVAVVLLLALPLLWVISNLWGYGGMMSGYGMMGRSYGAMNPFGWLGIAIMWLIPVAILVVLIVGVIALINNLTLPSKRNLQTGSPPGSRACQNCGKPTQADWNICPYCGQSLV